MTSTGAFSRHNIRGRVGDLAAPFLESDPQLADRLADIMDTYDADGDEHAATFKLRDVIRGIGRETKDADVHRRIIRLEEGLDAAEPTQDR